MDMKKMNIPTLDGHNWGQYVTALHAAAHIFGCYDVIIGEILTTPPNPTYDLLSKPAIPLAQASAADLATYNAAKAVWNKKNAQALGLMQATVVTSNMARLQPLQCTKRPVQCIRSHSEKWGEH